MLATRCSSTSPRRPSPSETRPVRACLVSCPDGYAIRIAHLCRTGKRWFEDLWLYAERVERSADGVVTLAYWIGRGEGDAPSWRQDYDQRDVVMGDCSQFTRAPIERAADRGNAEPAKVPF